MRFVGDLALVYYTVTWVPEMVDGETAGGTIMAPP